MLSLSRFLCLTFFLATVSSIQVYSLEPAAPQISEQKQDDDICPFCNLKIVFRCGLVSCPVCINDLPVFKAQNDAGKAEIRETVKFMQGLGIQHIKLIVDSNGTLNYFPAECL